MTKKSKNEGNSKQPQQGKSKKARSSRQAGGSRPTPAGQASRPQTSQVDLIRAIDRPVGFTNRGVLKAAAFSGPGKVEKAVSQFLNPLGGCLQRIPPGVSGQMSITSTALASTHQVLRLFVPSGYASITSYPTIPVSVTNASEFPSRPLFDFSQGVPVIHFWDSCTPMAYPSFGISEITSYRATVFSNGIGGNRYLVPFDVAPLARIVLDNVNIAPLSLPVISSSRRAGPFKPLVQTGENVAFWCDSSSTISVDLTLYCPGTGIAGQVFIYVDYYGPNGEPTQMGEDFANVVASGNTYQLSISTKASGWHSVRASVAVNVALSVASAYMTVDRLQVDNILEIQTAFVTNTAYVENVALIQGDRVLGSSVQMFCNSPVLNISGRFLGAIGHNFSTDFRDAVSDLFRSVNASPNSGFYDGPLLSMGKADGGIYSVVSPKRGFVMEDVETAMSYTENYATSNLFPQETSINFGYNIIVIRPTFSAGTTGIEFEVVLAQAIEYLTGSQFLQTEKTNMSQTEFMTFTDTISSVNPFCANPFHLKMVKDFLSRATHAVRDGVEYAARALPMASKVALVLGHPEMAASLGAAGLAAGKISQITGGV